MTVRDQEGLESSFPMSIGDWTTERAGEAVRAFYENAIKTAEARIGWYNRRGGGVGRWSRGIRVAAIGLGMLGGVMPLLATTDVGRDLALQSWGYVAIALAAALIAADSAFGFSTSWIRYRTTQIEMERLLTGFRFDWAIELGKLNGSAPRPEQVENLLRVQRNFAEAIEAASEAETNTWVQEFRSSLAELAKAYRSASAARVPGAIDVRVTNAAKAEGDIDVLIDRRPAGALIGANFQIAEVPPGHHGVQVRGRIGGRESAASGMVEVKPGEVVRIDLALVDRTANDAVANGHDRAAGLEEQADRSAPRPAIGDGPASLALA